jgi:hypothetical protein
MISTWLTLGLVVLAVSGLLMTRSATLSIPFTIFGLFVSSSFGTLAGLITPAAREPVFFVTIIVLASSALAVFSRHKVRPNVESSIGIVVFGSAAFAIQMITRNLGLGSVAFGDGHTILLASQAFQDATGSLLVGSQGLKRGFALPALHSFGAPGEYAVGFMPLIFLAAIVVTLKLFWELAPTRAVFLSLSVAVVVIVVSTEAILRHLYLMNGHSAAWLICAYLLLLLLRYTRSDLSQADLVGVLLALASIAFLRLDFLMLFSPFILVFLLVSAKVKRSIAFAGLACIAIPAWLWMTFTVQDFPYLGQVGPTILAMLGGIGGAAVILWFASRKKQTDILGGGLLWVISGTILFLMLSLTDFTKSLGNILTNLFLGEGLWGFTAVLLTLAALVSLTTKKLDSDTPFYKAALRLLVASVSVYVFAKFLDGQNMWSIGSAWARVGFGDSLNRTLITWLPFLFMPMIRIFAHVLSERPSVERSPRTSITKRKR